jgi:hypothetical protein
MVLCALENDNLLAMSIPAGQGRRRIGILVRIFEHHIDDNGQLFIHVVGVSRLSVVNQWVVDGCVLARILPLDDISIADEEAREARETTAGGQEGILDQVTKEDLDRLPTATLMHAAVKLTDGLLDDPSTNWINREMVPAWGCPDDPVYFPWWFACAVAGVSVTEKVRLLGSTSVRERLKICWEWMIDRGYSFILQQALE